MGQFADIYEVLRHPLFWTLSAVGSLILGVLGNVITPHVVGWIELRSQSRLHRRRRTIVRFFGQVIVLDGRENGITHGLIDGVYSVLLGTFFLLVALVLFFVSNLVGHYVSPFGQIVLNVVFGLPLAFLCVFCVSEGMKSVRLVRTVQRRQRAFEQFARDNKLEYNDANRNQFYLDWDMKNLGTNVRDALKEFKDNPLLKDAD